MLDLSSRSTEFAPTAPPWFAGRAHPVPPPSGSYIFVDHTALLSAATPGLIPPVLVLPRLEEGEQVVGRLNARADRG
jgi:hypothetical protein